MSNSNTTATRLITLIMTLQRQPNQKASDRAAKLGKRLRSFLLILAYVSTACSPTLTPTPPVDVCWQCSVDGMAALTADLQTPEHLLQPDAVKTGVEFDVNEYFTVLDRLSMQSGYVLDYVYWYDDLGAHPVLYARRVEEPAFEDFSDYIAARGESQLAYLEHVQADGSAEGFFQLVVLRLMGDQFYLWWHATMNDINIVTDQASLQVHQQVVEANCTEPFDTVLQQASELDLEPRVTFEGDLVDVSIHAFSSYSGLVRKSFSIEHEFPHTFVDESTESLLEYFCGVVP